MRSLHPTRTYRKLALGVTLIELMVAVAIGAFLMIGAMTVFMQSRTSFRITQTVSRLQENARFALATIEPDIRMASYYGLTSRGTLVTGRALTTQPNGIGPATCGANWAIDLENPVAGTNNAYNWGCGASAGGWRNGTDTIVIRRTAEDPVAGALQVGRLYVQSSRSAAQIFTGTVIPSSFNATTSQTFELHARGYYIANQSQSLGAKGAGIPSLHRKTLGPGPAITDEEILAGVEDLQIEFGVDTDKEGAVNRGSVDRYVNANDPILNPMNPAYNPDAVIIAVRIWLRLRAEDTENGFSDTTNYVYADVNYTPPAGQQQQFRRLLVTKTIYVRNARPMS
jgi:type IV pilus assembly protein PilW